MSDKLAERARAETLGYVSGVGVGVVNVTGAGVAAVVAVVGAGAAGAAITSSATSIASPARMGIPGRFPEGGAIPSPSAQSLYWLMRYLSRTVRVIVRWCSAPSTAANRMTSVTAVVPCSRRVGMCMTIRLCGWEISDSVS